MSLFVTNAQFLSRFDWRWVAKNVSDTGAVAVPPPVTAATLATYAELTGATGIGATLNQLITDAEELVMGAACVAARYSQADLLTYGGNLLARIVCGLTIGLVVQRRGRAVADDKEYSQPYTEALDYLEQLRRGERIFFAVPNVPEAGLLSTAPLIPVPGAGVPTLAESAARFFGALNPGIATRFPYPGG